MTVVQPTFMQKLFKAFAVNPQRQFGSYAAELSFYIIWAIIPLLLAFANVIAVLPFSSNQIITVIDEGIPNEVGDLIMPILESYIQNTSTSAFSVGLIISLWPASNVFNTIQRILNTIFNAKPRNNALIARGFAYVFTLAIVLIVFSAGLVFIFGETILEYIMTTFGIKIPIIGAILGQSDVIGLLSVFGLMFLIYQYMPNVAWSPKYAVIGAVVATVGFSLISQLFSVYLSFNKNIDSNTAIGLFIVAIIWLYFNMMVIAIGAYATVIAHDVVERSYWEMEATTKNIMTFEAKSKDFKTYGENEVIISGPLMVKKRSTHGEGVIEWQE